MEMIKRHMMLSLASTVSPEAQAHHRDQLRMILRSPIKRAAAMGIHALTTAHPGLAENILGLDLDFDQPALGLRHIRNGLVSSVFRRNETEVLKIDQLSVVMSPTNREAYASKEIREHRAMMDYLGELGVKHTEAYIGAHPFASNNQAFQTVQPYREFSDPELFQHQSAEAMAETIAQLNDERGNTIPGLVDLSERSRSLYDHKGLLPDTRGIGNIVFDISGTPIVIDGQPTNRNEAEYQQIILGHLDMVDRAVLLAA